MKNLVIELSVEVKKFGSKGEKSGWTYVEIDELTAQTLVPGNKKSFRIKGYINNAKIEQTAIIPMGGGSFILPLNSKLRKAASIVQGEIVNLKISVDKRKLQLDKDFIACLNDDEEALNEFNSLTPSHQNYFSNYISEAKTTATKTKRITRALNALSHGLNFAEMLRANKK